MIGDKRDAKLGIEVATNLDAASEDEFLRYFERLRRERRLSTAVRELNVLLKDAHHEPAAERALKRIGLWHSG